MSVWKKNMLLILISVLLPWTAEPANTATIINNNALQWFPTKEMPPGAEVAILSGNPTRHEHFIARVKLPANYIVPAHSHDIVECDTVISGTYYLGNGKIADAKKGIALNSGDFAIIPKNSQHYGYTKVPTVIQISSDGPWGMIYQSNG